ncbi:MAG: hypothetical protein GEU95_25465 [Rhizobiales bacterium]|nr:hypothetical protein [Hyphomicrobiales bacterium]
MSTTESRRADIFVAKSRRSETSSQSPRSTADAMLRKRMRRFVTDLVTMSIVFLSESPPFEQDEIVDMALAVDNVCEVLEIAPEDAPTMKSIAERVVQHARRGERDPEVLAERVISEMRAADSGDAVS